MAQKLDKATFMQQVKINLADLTVDMSEQAALFANYATMKVIAEDEEARRKLEREAMEYQLDEKLRKTLSDPTEKKITAAIKRNPAYVKADIAYLDAKHVTSMLSVAVEAFEMRARMLSSIGALTRSEMEQQYMGTPAGNRMASQAEKLADRVKRKLHGNQP